MILKVIAPYRAGDVAFDPGQEFHGTEDECARMLRDAPSCFEAPAGFDPYVPGFGRVADPAVDVGGPDQTIVVEVVPEEIDDLDSMTVAELRDHAADNDISLAGARTRAQVLERIRGN